METWFINSSTHSPPVKWNCFTCGGGIFGFAKNDYDVEKLENAQEPTGAASYTLKFNANGGSVTTSKTVTYNSTYGTLPTPTREGYNFVGWQKGFVVSPQSGYPWTSVLYGDTAKLKANLKVSTKYHVTFEFMLCEEIPDGYHASEQKQWGNIGFAGNNHVTGAQYQVFGDYVLYRDMGDNPLTGFYIVEYDILIPPEFDIKQLIWYGVRCTDSSGNGRVLEAYIRNINFFELKSDSPNIITSSSIVKEQNDHTLFALWKEKTWDDYAAVSYDSGSGTAASPYIIKTPAQMAKLAKDSRNSNLAGMNFKLAADVDMHDYLWNAISDFSGVFDGDMHTISGVSSVEGNGNQGLFGVIAGPCTIKNLILTNSIFYTTANAGAFCAGVEGNAGCNYFRLQNCIAQNITIISTDDKAHDSVGGLCGYVRCSDGLIENCMVNTCYISTISAGNSSALVGGLIYGANIKNSCALNVDMRGSQNQPIRPTTRLYDSNCDYEGTYVEFKKNGIMYKEIKGSQQQFNEAYFYNLNINKGYPLPRALVSFSDTLMGTGTYDFLVGKGFQYIKDGVIST